MKTRCRPRYEVVVFSRDTGMDESLDFSSIREARKHLTRLLQGWESGAVFDRAKKRYIHAAGESSYIFDEENTRLAKERFAEV